jgi:tRNA A37 threonylcarbamoyladenosine dehydratase
MDTDKRFAGIERLYGKPAAKVLQSMHVCIVGLGGVGSWVVEALVRSGVGKLTLIDYDEIAEGNINRQMHAMSSTLGKKKTAVMQDRVIDINPACECMIIDDYINEDNLWDYLSPEREYDYVVDAIDSIKFKSSMIYFCKRNKIPIITTGGAGGITDPASIGTRDLSRTYNDALAARVRSRLRSEFGFSRNPKRYFGVECVYSSQQKVFPNADGSVSTDKPGIHGVHLDCSMGYGSISFVTACFGFIAASRVVNKLLAKKLDNVDDQQ